MKRIITITILCLGAIAMFGQTTPALKVANTGFVGIGQGTPTQKLEIYGTAASTPGFLVNAEDQNFVKAAAGQTASAFFYKDATFFTVIPGADASFVGDGTSASKSLTVAGANGFVGVGTWTPAARLDVRGGMILHEGTEIHSDKRLKNNIVKFEAGIDELMMLNTIEYEYNGQGGTTKGAKHIGIVAQDLQKAVPNLVREVEYKEYDFDNGLESSGQEKSRDSFLAIRDNEVKYLLINAIKDQQAVIENQEDRINALEEMVNSLVSIQGDKESSDISLGLVKQASLKQNNPNPFNQSTAISYEIPQTAKSALMKFYSLDGTLIRTENITHTGTGVLNVEASSLPTGTYSYILEVDGQPISSKKMVKAN